MARPVYDNSYNRNKTRVDGRQDNWATRAGVTGQHKDSAGNVIGGVGADGTRFGTKTTLSVPAGSLPANEVTTANTTRTGAPDPRWQAPGAGELGGSTQPPAARYASPGGIPEQPATAPPPTMPQPSATPRLDAGVQTPRLNSNPAQDNNAKVAASNRSGAFGSGPQNLQGRRDLYAKMQAAGAGAISDDMRGQAAKLGVTMGGWDSAVKRLTQAPAGIAATNPTIPWQSGPAVSSAGIPKPPAPQPGMKRDAPVGNGANAPQPNAKVGAAVPRMAAAPATPKSPAPTAMPSYHSWSAQAAGTSAPNGQSAPIVAPAAQAIAGKPPTTTAPAPVKPPVLPPAPTAARPINNPSQVSFQNPWSGVGKAFTDSYAAERENLKKPGRFSGTPIASMLRGATGAAGKFARTNWANLTQTY